MRTTLPLLLHGAAIGIVNAATCANTDGAGTAYSANLCLAANKLRKSNWASASCSTGQPCSVPDCCAALPSGLGNLASKVV